MSKRSIVYSGIVLILVILIVGGFWAWKDKQGIKINQQKNQTVNDLGEQENNNSKQESQLKKNEITPPNMEDWRTAKWISYKDEQNGFEVQYPETFSPDLIDISNRQNYQKSDVLLMHKDTLRYIRALNYGAAQIDNSVYISVMNNQDNLTLKDWVVKNNKKYSWECNNNDNEQRIKCENGGITDSMARSIMINSKEAMLMSEESIGDNSIVLFQLKNNNVVQFYFKYGSYDMNNGDNFFRKMMESFRIIR